MQEGPATGERGVTPDDLGLMPTKALIDALLDRYDYAAFVGVKRTGESAHYKYEWRRPNDSGHPIDDLVVIGAVEMLRETVVRKLVTNSVPPDDEHADADADA